MSEFVPISAAAKALCVSISTLLRWKDTDRLTPVRTEGGQRRYDLAALRPGFAHGVMVPRQTVAYARVSSHEKRTDLERQRQVLELYCASQGWRFEVIRNLGSSMNYHKKGLKRLLERILAGDVGFLVPTHKDLLLRFGAELVFTICEAKEVKVVINQGGGTSFEEELANDVLEIIAVSSTSLYGSPNHRNQKLINGAQRAVKEAQC